MPELKSLTANGKFTVNFTGITTEKAFAGGKSFKYEVTSEGGIYFTTLIPFTVPTEGPLNLSCRYQVASTGKGKFGPGTLLIYPAISTADGVDFFDWKNSTDGGWTWLTTDLTAFAKHRITSSGWAIQPDQVLATVKGLVICFTGMTPGERMTLYIDDLMVDGAGENVTGEFNSRAAEQWHPVKEKHLQTIQTMQKSIQNDGQAMAGYTNRSSAAMFLHQRVRANLTERVAITQTAAKRQYLLAKEVADIYRHEDRCNRLLSNMAMLDGYDFNPKKKGSEK